MASPTNLSSLSVPQVVYTSNIQRASQIPSFCAGIAQMFENLKLFDGVSNSRATRFKVIPLDKWDDIRICVIFTKNAKQIIGDNSNTWNIYSFGTSNDYFKDSTDKSIKQGVQLCLWNDLESLPLKGIQDAYDQVFHRMVTGWASAKAEDNPEVFSCMVGSVVPSEEDIKLAESFRIHIDFTLFIKQSSLADEEWLFRHVIRRLSMEESVLLYSNLKLHLGCYSDSEKGHCKHAKTYMWIKKSDLPESLDKLGFNFH